jgi:GNAT superfamily N-acetyltransferase
MEESVALMRACYAREAHLFDLTERNCPSHPAFISVKKLEKLFQSARVRAYGIYEAEGEAMKGYLLIRYLPRHTCEIIRMCVAPDRQRQGNGTQLLEYAAYLARLGNCNKLIASIALDHDALLVWCWRRGFRVESTLKIHHLPYTMGYIAKHIEDDKKENG